MAEPSAKSALLGAAARAPQPIPFQYELAALLVSALERAVARVLQDSITCHKAMVVQNDVTAVLDGLDPLGMTLTLIARGTQPVGLVSLTPALVAQLALRISGATATTPTARSLSRVDQSLARLLVLRAVEALQDALVQRGAKAEAEGLRCGSGETVRHVLQSSLTPGKYASFQLNLPVANGADNADDLIVTFHFTLDFCAALAQAQPTANTTNIGAEARHWQVHMQRVALLAPINSRCVLDRFALTTGEMTRLKTGDVIALPGRGLDDVTLELPHQNGKLAYARGKLGVYRRSKALKLRAKMTSGPQDAPLGLTDQRREFTE